MDEAEARARVDAARVGRLATVRPDGRPHVVVCCFAIVGDTIVTAVDGKPKSTAALQRLANVRANPSASLLVDHYAEDWRQLWWVRVDGRATVVDDAAAVDALVAKYPQYREVRPPGPVLVIDELAWRSWSSAQ